MLLGLLHAWMLQLIWMWRICGHHGCSEVFTARWPLERIFWGVMGGGRWLLVGGDLVVVCMYSRCGWDLGGGLMIVIVIVIVWLWVVVAAAM